MAGYVEVIQTILEEVPEGIRMDPRLRQAEWHEEATQRLTDSALEPRDYLEYGNQILANPDLYQEAKILLENKPRAAESLGRLALLREAMIIGRNNYNLANQSDLFDDEQTLPLPLLIINLGRFLDGSTAGYFAKRRLLRDFEPAESTLGYIAGDFKNPLTKDVFLQRATEALHTPKLVDGSDGRLTPHWVRDEQEYLTARRAFRGVVDLVLIDLLDEPTEEKRLFFQRGWALNQAYKTRHEAIANQQAYL